MNITIFGNSTGSMCYENNQVIDGASYIERLQRNYNVGGIWNNGYTIWNACNQLPYLIYDRRRSNWVILHVGVCEAMTMKAANFLERTLYWLQYYNTDVEFTTFTLHKMYKAAKGLTEGKDEYYRYFTKEEFRYFVKKVLFLLEGFSVLVMGLSCPSFSEPQFRVEQAGEFNAILKEESAKNSNVVFCDVWNLCSNNVQDSNHLDREGHDKLYNFVEQTIGVSNEN